MDETRMSGPQTLVIKTVGEQVQIVKCYFEDFKTT